MTQTELAELLGARQSFVAKYEGGERRLDIIELIRIARGLKFDLMPVIAQVSEMVTREADSR